MCCRTPLGIHRDYSDHGMLREKVSCETEVLHGIPGRNEENMIRRFSCSATLAASLLILLTFSCGKTFAPQPELKKEAAKPAPSIPRIEVTPAIQTKALTPKPGAKAVRKEVADTFGKGKASIMIKGHPGGVNHSFWSEELDLNGVQFIRANPARTHFESSHLRVETPLFVRSNNGNRKRPILIADQEDRNGAIHG